MKKLSLIPIALIVIVGVVWASSIITPDKPGFPSLPDTPGTIGYSLTHFFTPMGDALDTEKLNGVSASGYLRSTDSLCTNPGYVWKSIRPDGTAECQAKAASLLAIGIFSELSPGVEVSKNNGSTWSPANTTDILYNGDLIRTNSTGTGTIDFVADDSLLRLATDTLVQLEIGQLDGNTVAQAIVNNGSLWGRVLTSTGINIGGGSVVAGVRGTSVRVIASSPTLADIAIIDTANPQPATLRNRAAGGTTQQLAPGEKITAYNNVSVSSQVNDTINPVPIDLATDLTDTTRAENRFTQANLKLDLDYLLSLSGSSSKTSQSRINAEIASLTMEGTSTDQQFREMACSDYGTGLILWRPLLSERATRKEACVYAIADYKSNNINLQLAGGIIIAPTSSLEKRLTDSAGTIVNTISDNGIFSNRKCDSDKLGDPKDPTAQNGIYQFSTSGSFGLISGKTIYVKDPAPISCINKSSSTQDIFTYKAVWEKITSFNGITSTTSGAEGIYIGANQALTYPLSEIQDKIGGLAGKTIEIELDNQNTTGRILTVSPSLYYSQSSSGEWSCGPWNTVNTSCSNVTTPVKIGTSKISITIPSGVSTDRLLIGNNGAKKAAINTTIKSITISKN